MKIIEQYTEVQREVYGIYWAYYQGKQQRFHYIIPDYEASHSFSGVPEAECEVVDISIRNFVLKKSANGDDMFVHPILKEEDGLFTSLLGDGPADGMKHFLKKLAERGEYFPNKAEASTKYPIASSQSDGFYFCPNCFEANKPSHDYDEAIRCQNCETMFNLK